MTGRRRKGEGALFRKADGRWVGLVDLGSVDGRRRRQEVAGRIRSEVETKLANLVRQRHDERVTVADVVERWFGSLDVRLTTRHRYEQIVRLHIVPRLGHLTISELTRQHVEQMMMAMVQDGASPRSANHARTVLCAALYARRGQDVHGRNAASLAKRLHVAAYDVRPLSPADARAVLAAVAGDRLEALIIVSLTLGLRQGEALALSWADVDLEAGSLAVRRSLVRVDGAYHFGEPKTKRSRRTVPMAAPVVAALREHRGRQLQERLRAGPLWQGDTWGGLVFTDEVGAPLSTFHVGRRFRALIAVAGLPAMRYHDLRHGMVSLMTANGLSLRATLDVVGHSLPDPACSTIGIYYLPRQVDAELVRDETDRLAQTLLGRA